VGKAKIDNEISAVKINKNIFFIKSLLENNF
jgi:hypothetical protein